mgnify:CR=1 FL=1
MVRKKLSLLLLILILLIPAIHKVSNQIPPNWFIEKFSGSIIAMVPGGISICYLSIIILEFAGPAIFIIGLIQMIRKAEFKRIISMGFIVCYLLFLILTFGSFLVQDYDNGFKDFIYFVGVMLIERYHFSDEGKGAKW